MVHVLSSPQPSTKSALGNFLGQTISKTANNYLDRRQQEQQQKQEQFQQQKQQQQEMSALQQALSSSEDPQSQLQAVLTAPISNETKKLAVQSILTNQKSQQGQNLFRNLFGENQAQSNRQQQQQPGQTPGMQQAQPQQPMQQKAIDPRNPESWTMEQISTARSFAGQPGEAGIIGQMAENEYKRRELEDKARTAKEKEYFKFNEPKLAEVAKNQRTLQLEGARLQRLDELFKDPSKFPSALTASIFTKEGTLNDIAYSQLTPEAQEAVKLVIDMTSGIKDSYGARVTNFDLQTYLRKLPSLLNTPEGKKRIIRDLQQINKINQTYNQGIQEVFDEAGGSDKIPFSVAERKFDKKYGKEVDGLMKEFVMPRENKFKSLPKADQYLGKKIKNDETGEIFISDGKEWKPFKG